jgi:O-6-methylguanine DNA methyltransferase
MMAQIDTPCGSLWISGDRSQITGVSWEPLDDPSHTGELDWMLAALDTYFGGRSLIFPGRLTFKKQQPVWIKNGSASAPETVFERALSAISCIPPGETAAYGEIAASIGNPRLARFVGQVCKNNPLAIIVPCHRVVAKGSLGGYSPCLFRKEILLTHEGVDLESFKTRLID